MEAPFEFAFEFEFEFELRLRTHGSRPSLQGMRMHFCIFSYFIPCYLHHWIIACYCFH